MARKPGQFSLLDLPSLDVDAEIATSMSRTVQASGLSREQALDRLNEAARRMGVRLTGGKELSLATFEKWLNPRAAEHRPSVLALNLFCHAFRDPGPLRVLARSHGLGWDVTGPEEARLADYARAVLDKKRSEKSLKRLEAELL